MNEEIKQIHDEVEQLPFSVKLANGELNNDDKLRYLNAHWLIFRMIEETYEIPHPSLKRKNKVMMDLKNLSEPNGIYMVDSAFRYTNHLLRLEDVKKQNAHIYLNYMAMMMGGSIITKVNPWLTNSTLFEDRTECVKAIRGLEIDQAEVIVGFQFHKEILQDLERESKN